ncbi:hypothetical protein CcaverHIS002_0102420 [Cutaneotrichosporon cavernicola]|uniref:Small nuclear ribonucleoprotein Prp3 C-terminal domain-containing protein n=1 Tax=Cutaneotrichosporon cavernicola TaxID=279322 RepID=A0AA48HXV3_9TREE|nr:uncharacterized protein CcaverHIS019_0102370 [Cutaneotrichosporon cavernicola]BEI79713.1 hypothetical protein CcaverHIS002_0102420 [Cutaneotrichosporon cavernicola]BEI87519.1 hypothetical protein CcaverHIS019_0102370 [Cutaneotrichosporon cavernicola]BEI95290.1 hypothetical protein CcaverHIS631_0102390 [Cutaneotrichosporon cavernicola]BEJ03064.1 hypothetical protein CcaverHIS641_0102390 [Cutaneotrichosporon cavernicola]
MSDALSTLELLTAMYPMDGELELSDSASSALAGSPSPIYPLDLIVRVPITDDDDAPRIELSISIPQSGSVRLGVRQPDFLTRAAYQTLVDSLPNPEGDATEAVMAAIEAIRMAAPDLIQEEPVEEEEEKVDDGPLERVWFWFPSLSTREKRKDLVTYAEGYRLNGFVLAGKPALLCVEGGGRAVDRYMADIKSVSWGDIPSFQKKVTERLRLPLAESDRKFKTMTDVTSLVPHYGTYNHRGDMSEVRRLCDEWGVGQDFNAVVMNSRDE